MNTISILLAIFLLPFQYFLLPAASFFKKVPPSQVEGASIQKKEIVSSPKEDSLRDSLEEAFSTKDENYGGAGFLPQRKENFREAKIFATSSVVIDVDTGTVLHYDNGRKKTPIASLTKMMTAIIVMEKLKNLDEPVTIDKEALMAEGTKVGCPRSGYCIDERLHEGEKITAKDLLMAMLLNSANDAAIALGKHIAGSQKEFAELMNEKAKELNLGDSNFCNPSGLDEDNCYSSAYDLARIAAYSMRYDLIWKIMRMPEAQVSSCDGKYSHLLKNTDLLLEQMPNCLGGKTGFTYNAGKSLMMAAVDPQKGKHRIVAVILNDNNRWEDMVNLINWTFDNYEWK